MALPSVLGRVPLPIIGAPLFIISHPRLVIAQCQAGVVGSMPALNARPASQLDEWLAEVTETLAAWDRKHPESPAAPFAVNQIVYSSLFTGVHGNSQAVDPRRWSGPGPPARKRPQQDGLPGRRTRQEGLEGHLGLRPGHRCGEGHRAGG